MPTPTIASDSHQANRPKARVMASITRATPSKAFKGVRPPGPQLIRLPRHCISLRTIVPEVRLDITVVRRQVGVRSEHRLAPVGAVEEEQVQRPVFGVPMG